MTHTARLGDRSLFPTLAPFAYLNHGGISPASVPVREAALSVIDDYARQGSGAYFTWHTQRLRLRASLAALIGAAADDIALVQNTSVGVSNIALCFPWREGDRVVLFEGEFPANVTAWLRSSELHRTTPVFLPLPSASLTEADWLARLERELRAGVRLVALSVVQFQTGYRMPLGAVSELCQKYEAELFLDAVQCVGATPIDLSKTPADYLACGAHKWLMGLEGAGMLYVNPARVKALRPHVAGWLSHEEPTKFLFDGAGLLRYDRPIRARADFFEPGNTNTAGFSALGASVDMLRALTPEAIWAHANRYNDALEAGLLARGFESARSANPANRSCTLSVRPPSGVSLAALHDGLGALGVTSARPDGWLRFTPHWPNALDEVPRVLDAVDEALAGARTP